MCANPVFKRRVDADAAMSAAEWQTRVDLAACYRLVAHYGMDDLTATHISARVPGKEEHFLINPFGWMFSQITASSLVEVDLDGTIVQDTPHVINPAGFVIHSAIHAARPDARCVLHTHTVAGMAIASMKEGILPLNQKSTRFHKRVAYHDFEISARDMSARERLVRDVGDKNYIVLRNHGLLVCGSTISQAFRGMFSMEKVCKTQLAIMSSGGTPIPIKTELLEFMGNQFARDTSPTSNRPDAWPSLKAMLDRINPGYED
ncbi:MAG TPA: class II aldolase/adducin family protein [Beijerinckiaceae bacterium]|nr:class II aldolase/adducin family protein [Beijerinckiaceae bacterium]